MLLCVSLTLNVALLANPLANSWSGVTLCHMLLWGPVLPLQGLQAPSWVQLNTSSPSTCWEMVYECVLRLARVLDSAPRRPMPP